MEGGVLTCPCDKKVKEIGTTNDVPSDFLPITGLDLTEKIDVNYMNTQSTRMPNDELAGLHGTGQPFPTTSGMYSYGKEPPHEPYLSEFVPCDTYCPVQEIWLPKDKLNLEESVAIPSGLSGQSVGGKKIPYSEPYLGDDTNWLGTASKINSEPSMHGEEGHLSTNPKVMDYQNENPDPNARIYNSPPNYILETEKRMARYNRYPHAGDVLCDLFDGKIVDLNDDTIVRPIPPTESVDDTNTTPNCECYWVLLEPAEPAKIEEKPRTREKSGQFKKEKDPHDPYKEALLKPVNVPSSTISRYGKYTRTRTEPCEICDGYEGKIYDLAKKQRPVPPSEGKGYTNTHPNCQCYYKPVDDPREETKKMAIPAKLDVLEGLDKKRVQNIHRKVGQRAKNKTLHTVFPDGKLSNRTRGTNPMKEIKETLVELHGQFNWFTDDYLAKIGELDKSIGGKFVLIRASAETITDHRSEGEPYRRLLKGEELMQLTRTGIGKTTDINHLGKEYEVDSQVLDAEYDPIRKESQMLVHLKDPEIIHFIETGQIDAVSINAGAPRRMDTECSPDECFVVPTGLILGELDGIAFTWVVGDPAGIVWRGKYIPKATAGIKTTKIEII